VVEGAGTAAKHQEHAQMGMLLVIHRWRWKDSSHRTPMTYLDGWVIGAQVVGKLQRVGEGRSPALLEM